MNDYENGSGNMRLGEIFVIVLVVAALLALLLSAVFKSRNAVKDRNGIAVTLRRIEGAKNQYAVEHKKKAGDPVNMRDLVRSGYLATEPVPPPGGAYAVGAIGTAATFEEDGHDHKHDHGTPP